MRVSLNCCLLVGSLLLGMPAQNARAQSACVSGSGGGGTSSPEGTCSGGNLHQRINYSFSAATEAQHCCQNNCWNGAENENGQHTGFAFGECQYAGAGQAPVCHPDFTIVNYWGYSSGDAIFKNQLRDVTATTVGCSPEPYDNETSTISIEDCCANRCQDSSGCNLIGEYNGGTCTCYVSPVIFDLDGGGLRLTDAAGGVSFDLACSGVKSRVAWTEAGSADGFLALDRNGNGQIDDGCELFGSPTSQPQIARRNGFNALSTLDVVKDGSISSIDPAYTALRVWVDTNHNGVSEPGELRALHDVGVQRINLAYKASSKKDRHGNLFRYQSAIDMQSGKQRRRETAYDVFLVGPGEECDTLDGPEAPVVRKQ